MNFKKEQIGFEKMKEEENFAETLNWGEKNWILLLFARILGSDIKIVKIDFNSHILQSITKIKTNPTIFQKNQSIFI